MERLAVSLRKSSSPNLFREAILSCFEADGINELLLCSGFFQERTTKNASFFASREFANRPPRFPCTKKITTVGLYNRIWRPQYDSFTAGLATIKCCCGNSLKVHQREIRSYQWHAKIFIAAKDKTPVLGIIGSSNITSRAFGMLPSWNFEADAIFWNEEDSQIRSIIERITGSEPTGMPELFVGTYDRSDVRNRDEGLMDRLAKLSREIEEISSAVV